MLRAFCAVVFIAALADSALAQTPAAEEQNPSMEELLRRMDALQHRAAADNELIKALQHRVDELESGDKPADKHATLPAGLGFATANRFVGSVTMRF
jgi:hypothetical protein